MSHSCDVKTYLATLPLKVARSPILSNDAGARDTRNFNSTANGSYVFVFVLFECDYVSMCACVCICMCVCICVCVCVCECFLRNA
jgi:hypothetical protein